MAIMATIEDNTSQASGNSTTARMRTADGLIGYVADYLETSLGSSGNGPLASTGFTVASSGGGYNVGDVLTQLGGTIAPGFSAYQVVVQSLGGGGAANSAAYLQGNIGTTGVPHYLTPPPNPITFGAGIGGLGSGVQVNITWSQLYPNGPYVPAGPPTIVSAGTLYSSLPGNYISISSSPGVTWSDPYGYVGVSWPPLQLYITSVGGGGIVTGVAIGGFIQAGGAAGDPLYIVAPTNPISFSGGSGSGYQLNATGYQNKGGAPVLAQWDLTTGAKTHETVSPFDATDLIYGPIAVRISDNHLFTINGLNRLYHIAPGLTLVGTYSATVGFPWTNLPAPWYSADTQTGISGQLDTRGAADMAVGQSRLAVFGAMDLRGSPYGVDIFDVSGANPAHVGTVNWPAYPQFPSPGLAPCLAIDPNDDATYVVTHGPASTKIGICKIASGSTSAVDVTPFVYTDYDFAGPEIPANDDWCVFCIDPVNRVLIFGGCTAHGSPNTYKITAYQLPGLTLLWHNDAFLLDGEFCTVGGNIVDGKWVTVVYGAYSGGSPGTAILTAFDVLTGAVGMTIDTATITNWSAVSAYALGAFVNCAQACVADGW